MRSLTFSVPGLVNTIFLIEEIEGGALRITVTVDETDNDIGDLRAVFFDLSSESLLDPSKLVATGDHVTDQRVNHNSVDSVGQDANVKGEVVNAFGRYDVGVEIGTQGISADDIQQTSLILTHSDGPLDINEFNWQNFAVRMTSVGKSDGSRGQSLKAGTTATAAPDAIDDLIVLSEDSEIKASDAGLLYANLLDNDQLAWVDAGDVYVVETVNGDAASVGVEVGVASSDGIATSVIVNEDGTVAFSAADHFDHLAVGETDQISIGYSIFDSNGGRDSATLQIEVEGRNDAPTLIAGSLFAIEDGEPVTLDLSTLGSDVDSDDDGTTLSYEVVAGPGEGTVEILGSTLSFDPGDGFQELNDGETAQTTITVRAIDSHSATSEPIDITVTVSGQDDVMPLQTPVLIRGAQSNDSLGYSVSDAGDIDGDGLDDIIVSATGASPGGTTLSGRSYVVFGSALAAEAMDDGILDLATITALESVQLNGIAPFDQAGVSVSGAGDVDGDGNDDIIIGAYRADSDGVSNTGESYVVYSSAILAARSINGMIDLADLTPSEGIVLQGGDQDEESGWSVSDAGDVDGDGLGDVIIGARSGSPFGRFEAGEAYLVFGTALADEAAQDGIIDLGSLATSEGVLIAGIDRFDEAGDVVSSAGDVDGDGLDDVMIGAFRADPNGLGQGGEAYVVFGSALTAEKTDDAVIDLRGLAPSSGILIEGADVFDYAGFTVSSAGDVDGDGLDDVLLGAPLADPDGVSSAGEAYLIYGSTLLQESQSDGTIELAGLAAANGIIFKGIDGSDLAGASLGVAGDVDGDGLSDILIASRIADPNGLDTAGETYLVYGSTIATARAGSGEIDLGGLSASEGVTILGRNEGDQSGFAVSSAGDVDGDGLADIVIGARNAERDGEREAGESYVISGAQLVDEALDDGILDLADYWFI